MYVGALELKLFIPEVRSLKEKRSVVRSVIERTRARFRVSVAEVGDNDVHQRAVIGVAAVGNDAAHVGAVLAEIRSAIEVAVVGRAEVVAEHTEVLVVGSRHL